MGGFLYWETHRFWLFSLVFFGFGLNMGYFVLVLVEILYFRPLPESDGHLAYSCHFSLVLAIFGLVRTISE